MKLRAKESFRIPALSLYHSRSFHHKVLATDVNNWLINYSEWSPVMFVCLLRKSDGVKYLYYVQEFLLNVHKDLHNFYCYKIYFFWHLLFLKNLNTPVLLWTLCIIYFSHLSHGKVCFRYKLFIACDLSDL